MNKNFIGSKNGIFTLNDMPFRFVGCNMYELANIDSATAELLMSDAFNEGFKVIRFWAFEPVDKNKLKLICALARNYDLKIIPVLADPSGYLQCYRIDDEWYKEGFKKNYLKHICDIASDFKNNEEILLWELINEPLTDSFESIYNFSKHNSEKIKTIDSNHLISIGTIGGIGDKFGGFFSRFNSGNFKTLYSLNSLDAVSLHDYSFNSTLLERLDIFYRLKGNLQKSKLFGNLNSLINYLPDKIDSFTLKNISKTFDFPLTVRSLWRRFNKMNISAAKNLMKPAYIGEIGFKKNLCENRKIVLQNELNKYFGEGVSGILLWSFEALGRSLDGHDYGFRKEDGFGEIVKGFRFNEKIKI